MEFKDDLYAVLGIPEGSALTIIKQAYHSLAKKYHPDVNNKGTKLFIEINEAYKILSDPNSKLAYDEYLAQKHKVERFNNLDTSKKDKDLQEQLQRDFKNKKAAFRKAATNTLHENIDDTFNEATHSNKYYIDPVDEPIFTVIQQFSQYRFEKAFGAIWNRSFFALLGATFVYYILFILSFIFKFFRIHIKKHNYIYHWLLFLNRRLINPRVIKSFCWSIILSTLTFTKFIANIFNTIYWIFKNLIVPFLLPNAVRSLKR